MIALKKARLYAGLSRNKLAMKADVSCTLICFHERGINKQYRAAMAKLLADALERPIDELFEIDEDLGAWVDKEADATP